MAPRKKLCKKKGLKANAFMCIISVLDTKTHRGKHMPLKSVIRLTFRIKRQTVKKYGEIASPKIFAQILLRRHFYGENNTGCGMNLTKEEMGKAYDIQTEFDVTEFNHFDICRAKRIMVIGPLDSGKTTLCRKLISIFCSKQLMPIYFFDLDIGQSAIGPPGTVGSALIVEEGDMENLSENSNIYLGFIGSLYPYGVEDNVYRSMSIILDHIPINSVIIIDTTGFYEVSKEVLDFKCKKIKILSPDVVVFLSDDLNESRFFLRLREETEKIGGKFLVLPYQSNNFSKTAIMRRAHHKNALRYWLENASYLKFPYHLLNFHPQLPDAHNIRGRLVGIIDSKCLCVGGGILIDRITDTLTIYGKLKPGGDIASIEVGTLKLKNYPEDYGDIKLNLEIIRDIINKGNYELETSNKRRSRDNDEF
ncbi:MAG: Clp1/GlmU family protein [Candidatus Aminicenantes bacterium]|nr:Clp1/GlmU family protein [Candidatus Aminicenantes bacterium]